MNRKLTIYRLNKEGWAYGKSVMGELFVGTVRKVDGEYQFWGVPDFYKDTPENRKSAEGLWENGSFAREIKVGKGC